MVLVIIFVALATAARLFGCCLLVAGILTWRQTDPAPVQDTVLGEAGTEPRNEHGQQGDTGTMARATLRGSGSLQVEDDDAYEPGSQSLWSSLPGELLCKIFRHLQWPDLLQAELCCLSWHSIISRPKGVICSEPLVIKLHKIFCKARQPVKDASATEHFFPIWRWVRRRVRGSSSLTILAAHFANNDETDLTSGFAMLLTALQDQRIDLHIELQCKLRSRLDGWLAMCPFRQQILTDHLVSLDQRLTVTGAQEFVSICGLTRLTSLQLSLDIDDLSIWTPAESVAITSLQNLRRLELTGFDEGPELANVDWQKQCS
ncbi:hypothetical protein WJX73_010024 [Symbiochloris irregularis]|uniref:F-box domain-containing protein n=1 Tax=Symbiochloris irregularis TaxID=706552 RepID=A0AAW1NVU4_9CHLO